METNNAKIIIPKDVNVWPHELKTAKALVKAGHTVEFIRRSEERHITSADVYIDGEVWEIKSPESKHMKAIQKNFRKALKQSCCIIVDSRRMKEIPSNAIEREVKNLAAKMRSVKHVKFIRKNGEVVDIL